MLKFHSHSNESIRYFISQVEQRVKYSFNMEIHFKTKTSNFGNNAFTWVDMDNMEKALPPMCRFGHPKDNYEIKAPLPMQQGRFLESISISHYYVPTQDLASESTLQYTFIANLGNQYTFFQCGVTRHEILCSSHSLIRVMIFSLIINITTEI